MGNIKVKIIEHEERVNVTPDDYPYLSDEEVTEILSGETMGDDYEEDWGEHRLK